MSQQDPEVEEEETQEEKHKSGRSAFMAGFHRGEGDSFSGAFRGVPAPKRGGAQAVKDSDMPLGAEDLCWCGQPGGHDWPGKAQKRPHPRGEQMSAATQEKPYLNPRDLKAWDVKVVRALCALVNEYGVRYRLDKNQMHIFLFAPGAADDTVSKFKASRSRPAEQTLKYVEQWAVKYVRPAKVEEALPKLAEKFNDPTKKPHERTTKERSEAASAAHERRTASTPTPAPKEPAMPVSAPPAPVLEFKGDPQEDGLDDLMSDEPPKGYEPYNKSDGTESRFWKKTGAEEWVCKDCGWPATNPAQFSGHYKVHNQPMFARKRFIAHLTRAAKEVGIDLADYEMSVEAHKAVRKAKVADTSGLTKQIEKLTADLEKVTQERDDLRARLALLKEAMGA